MKYKFSVWLQLREDTPLYAQEPPVSWRLKPHKALGQVASDYMTLAGMDPKKLDITYDPLNHVVGKNLASEYEKLQHSPNDPSTKRAYDAFKKETLDQFQHLLKAGYNFVPDNDTIGQGGGYTGAADMRNDVINNKLLRVFVGGDLPPDHPLAEPSFYVSQGHRFNYNELFRAVHDFFGHAHHGNHFGPRGEEHAYRLHSRMYSPQAVPAMAAETRGQNSWLHYGPYSQVPLEDRPYASQKAAIMPSHLLGDIHLQQRPTL